MANEKSSTKSRSGRTKTKLIPTGTLRHLKKSKMIEKKKTKLDIQLTPSDKVLMVLKHGHLIRDKFPTPLPTINGKIKKHKLPMHKERLISKSGEIRTKTKDTLYLIDKLLKQELNIDDSKINKDKEKKPKKTYNGVNNNVYERSDSFSENDVVSPRSSTSTNSSVPKTSTRKKQSNKPKSRSSRSKEPEIEAEKPLQIKRKHTKKSTKDSSAVKDTRKGKSKKTSTKVKKKSVKGKEKKITKTKQVTLSNGVVLTLSLFQCDYCSKTFSNKSSLRRHIFMHLGIRPYKCNYCFKRFRQRSNMKNHVARYHPDQNPEVYSCTECNKPFLLLENLTLHLTTHVKAENFHCLYCDKKFSHHLLLLQHEKQHLVAGRFQCSICSMSYDCRSRLAIHVKSHLNIKDYVCQYCGKEFLRANSIRRHVEVCHGGYRVSCPICNKKLKGHLAEHIRLHDKVKPHVCPDCGQEFTQSTQLRVHRRLHTGARPYPCKICKSKFSHSNALSMHIRRHTGEKPFACPMCPLFFSQLPHMKTHMKVIHGKDKTYKCEKCSEFFKLKSQLESHTKVCKIGVKPLSFEEQIQASIQPEIPPIDSPMHISRMRFLLALLLTMIASKEKLKYLGFNKRLIDELLIDSLEAMGHDPCKDKTLTPLRQLKTNIEILLKGTVPQDQMDKFRQENKTTEEILELLTKEESEGN